MIKMTKEQIEQRIKQLEDQLFYLDMKDRWDRQDYETHDKIVEELRELQEQEDN